MGRLLVINLEFHIELTLEFHMIVKRSTQLCEHLFVHTRVGGCLIKEDAFIYSCQIS